MKKFSPGRSPETRLLFFFLALYFFVRTALRQIMGQVNFKKLLKLPNFIDIFHCCMTRPREKKEDVS